MERYYKVIENDRLLLIGTGEGGEEISREEYDRLLEEIKNIPFVVPEIEDEVLTDG